MNEPKTTPITIDKGAALSNVDMSTKNTNTTVVYQGGAAEEKKLEENKAFFRDFVRKYVTKGIVTDEIRRILDEQAFELGLSNIDRDMIIEQVRSFVPKASSLSEIQRRKFEEARTNIFRNTEIDSAIRTLKALSEKCSNEEIDFFYNMAMSAKSPADHINQYKNRKTDSYWQTYWAYLSFVKMRRYEEAEDLFLDLDNFDHYPTANVMPLLKNAALLIKTSDSRKLKAAMEAEDHSGISQELTMLCTTMTFVADNGLVLAAQVTYANFYLENFFNVKQATYTPKLTPAKTVQQEKEKPQSVKLDNPTPSTPPKISSDPFKEVTSGIKDSTTPVRVADKSKNSGKRTLIYAVIGIIGIISVSNVLKNLFSDSEKAEARTEVQAPTTDTEKPGGKTGGNTGGKTGGNTGGNTAPVRPLPPPPPPEPKLKAPAEMSPAEAVSTGKTLLASGKSSQAVTYLNSAAERGSLAALYELSHVYKDGTGVAKNTATAFSYMKAAAVGGYTKAYRELGEMYHGGRGVEKDRTQAQFWYEKAVAAGDAKAQRILNNM